ncbi:hypothetical protein MTO96_017551 [Rhipicephalus appendiculatus]
MVEVRLAATGDNHVLVKVGDVSGPRQLHKRRRWRRRGDVPDAQVGAASAEQPFVPSLQGDAAYPLAEAGTLQLFLLERFDVEHFALKAPHVPAEDGAVLTGRVQLGVVRSQREVVDVVRVSRQRRQQRSRLDVPHVDLVVPAAGYEYPLVRVLARKNQGVHFGLDDALALRDAEGPGLLGGPPLQLVPVPGEDLAVPAADEKVVAHDQREDVAGVSGELVERFPRR